MSAPAARLTGVVKRFGAVTALDGARLELSAGDVHGVLGENGAGKTTLFHVLGGLLQPDSGAVEIDGQPRDLHSPRDAWAAGVGLVHQHFTLVPRLSALENLALGLRAGGGFRLDLESLASDARSLAERTGLEVPLDAPVEGMGVGTRQRLEILKALLREPRILVLDEPTAVLTPGEVHALFQLLRELAAEGRAVALVAHKLDEVLGVASRVTVLRRGRTVLEARREDVDAGTLTRAMVGRDDEKSEARVRALGGHHESDPPVRAMHRQRENRGPDTESTERERPRQAEPDLVATLEDARVRSARGAWAVDGVSLRIRRGEIVGIAGVEGNGQKELARVLAGRLALDEGKARIPGGVGFIPQDRTREGVIGSFDLAENVALALHRDERMRSGPVLRWAELRRRADRLMRRYDVRAPGTRTLADELSGGNQQRIVVARELAVAQDLLVAENPTRGLDVAATVFVHAELHRLVGRTDAPPPGVVLISTDLDEVLVLSGRVLVMVRGRLSEVPPDRRTREGVGSLMLAGSRAPA